MDDELNKCETLEELKLANEFIGQLFANQQAFAKEYLDGEIRNTKNYNELPVLVYKFIDQCQKINY